MLIDYIPELSPYITIQKIESDNNFFIVYNSFLEKRVKINLITKQVIDLIDSKKNVQDITISLNDRNSVNIDEQQIIDTITKLQIQGVIISEKEIKKNRVSHIWFKTILISQKKVEKISSCFVFLFFNHIYLIIAAIFLSLSILYYKFLSINIIYDFLSLNNILLTIPIIYLGYFLHEFGHASAIKKFGLAPGSIGFGFYLLSPVFFANVNNAWNLIPPKRIIINIAGMYFQLILSLILALLFIVTLNKWFLVTSLFNFINIIPNLNPFVKFDGYWILSDALNINNLTKKAEAKSVDVFNFLFKSNFEFPLKSKRDYFLLIYFLLNKTVVIIFLILILFSNKNSLISFPINLYNFGVSLIHGVNNNLFGVIKDFLFNNFYSIIFYSLCVIFIRQIFAFIKTSFLSFLNLSSEKKKYN